MLAPHRLAALDDLLVELNAAAAQVILPLFRADHGLENKFAEGSGFDPVTEADKGLSGSSAPCLPNASRTTG